MKLLDILARELKVWPEENYFAWQDYDREIRFSHTARHDFHASILADDHVRSRHGDDPDYGVTRAEWQDAVDALNQSELDAVLAKNEQLAAARAERIPVWNGEGLPPVGLDVEIKRGNCTWIDGDEWQIGKTATVMASFLNSRDIEMASVQFPGGHCECILARCLSPIRTAEQVAAEEREAEDNEIMSRYLSLSDCEKGMLGRSPERVIIGLMRVMGYRKEPKPCGS